MELLFDPVGQLFDLKSFCACLFYKYQHPTVIRINNKNVKDMMSSFLLGKILKIRKVRLIFFIDCNGINLN